MPDTTPPSPFHHLRDLDTLGRMADSMAFRSLSVATAASDSLRETSDALARQMGATSLSALEEALASVAPMADVVGAVYRSIRPLDLDSKLGSSVVDAAREQLFATDVLVRSAYPALGDVLRDMPRAGDFLRNGSRVGDSLVTASNTHVGSALGQLSALVEQARDVFKQGDAIRESALGNALRAIDPWPHLRDTAIATQLTEWHQAATASQPSLADLANLASPHDGIADAFQRLVAELRSTQQLATDAAIDALPAPGALDTPEIRNAKITLFEQLKTMSPLERLYLWIALFGLLAAYLQLVPRSDESTETFQKQITQQIAALTEAVIAMEARQPVVLDQSVVLKRGKGEGGTVCIVPAGTTLRVHGKSGRWLLVEAIEAQTGKPIQGWVLKHHLCR